MAYSGLGHELLPYGDLKFILLTDPVLGSSSDTVPDGPFNRELNKLLANDRKLAQFVKQWSAKTYATVVANALDAGTVPSPLNGAPGSPSDGAIHVIYYNDYVVTFIYSATTMLWAELNREARVTTSLLIYRKTLTLDVEAGETNINFNLPTTDDDGASVSFSVADIKIMYVNNLDAEAPIIGLLAGMNVSGAALRVVLTAEPEENNDYQVVVVFEKLVQVA